MTLEGLGLRAGEQVRFRRPDRSRWQTGVVRRLERDGSVGLVDADGASRAIPVDAVEVRCTGRRGGAAWEPLLARAARTEQLDLLASAPVDADADAGDRSLSRGRRSRGQRASTPSRRP